MEDQDLSGQILGIKKPWRVDRVDLKLAEGEVDLHLEHDTDMDWEYAEGGKLSPLHDHQPERQWRHLDTCQIQTILHLKPPRTN